MHITKTIRTAADDCNYTTCRDREDAAIALNQRFQELVNKGATRNEVRNGMRLSDYATWAQRTPKAAISSKIVWTTSLSEQWTLANNAPTIRTPSNRWLWKSKN